MHNVPQRAHFRACVTSAAACAQGQGNISAAVDVKEVGGSQRLHTLRLADDYQV